MSKRLCFSNARQPSSALKMSCLNAYCLELGKEKLLRAPLLYIVIGNFGFNTAQSITPLNFLMLPPIPMVSTTISSSLQQAQSNNLWSYLLLAFVTRTRYRGLPCPYGGYALSLYYIIMWYLRSIPPQICYPKAGSNIAHRSWLWIRQN